MPDRTGIDVLVVADGASVHTRRLLRALGERDLRVELATFESTGLPRLVEHRLGASPPGRDSRYLFGIGPLARVIRVRRPAIIHAHYVSSYGVMAALALRIARGPRLMQTAWGTDLLVTAARSRIHRALAAVALRAADLNSGDSLALEQAAAALAPERPWLRFVFGPPVALLEIEKERERLVISMRRLDPDMRVETVVLGFRRACELEQGLLAGWRLLVAGDGTRAQAVRTAAAGDPAIELAGALDQPTLHRRIGDARIQVSIPVSDTTSAALLDGLAAGLVPVVSDLPGPCEWVDASVGEIVPRDPTVAEVAGAIVRAVQRDIPRERLRDRVREVTWEKEIDRLTGAYRTLLPH